MMPIPFVDLEERIEKSVGGQQETCVL